MAVSESISYSDRQGRLIPSDKSISLIILEMVPSVVRRLGGLRASQVVGLAGHGW
jgi:hypothetical protein